MCGGVLGWRELPEGSREHLGGDVVRGLAEPVLLMEQPASPGGVGVGAQALPGGVAEPAGRGPFGVADLAG